MKISVAAALAILVISAPVKGDCLPSIEGSIQATFLVNSCRMVKAPRPDRRPLIRLSVSELKARASPEPGDSAESISSYDHYVAILGQKRHLFVDAAGGATCADFPTGTEHTATIEILCCDTIPHKGICALAGPLIRPN